MQPEIAGTVLEYTLVTIPSATSHKLPLSNISVDIPTMLLWGAAFSIAERDRDHSTPNSLARARVWVRFSTPNLP